MAEATGGDCGGGGGGGWWGNLMSVAKNKSAEVFEFMKRDFDEFSSAVKSEASTLANQTASAVKETLQLDNEESTANSMKRSVSTFLGQMKEALSPSPSTEFDEALVIHEGNPISMTKLQRKIYALASEDATYLEAVPDDCRGQFESWLEVATQSDSGGGVLASVDRLTNMLAVNPTLQTKYTTLVPDKVSHTDFWQRYLFKKAVIEDAEAERERRLERERKQAENYRWEKGDGKKKSFSKTFSPKDEAIVSGKAIDIDLTEEEQIKILEQYERERQERLLEETADRHHPPRRHLIPAYDFVEDSTQASVGTPDPSPIIDGVMVNSDDPMDRDNLTMREKKDMVIVGNGPDMSQTSSSSKASTDGDWEKEFDIDDPVVSPAAATVPEIPEQRPVPEELSPTKGSSPAKKERHPKKNQQRK